MPKSCHMLMMLPPPAEMEKGFEIAAKFQGERDTHPRGGRHGERDNNARQNDGGGKEKRS